MSHQPSRIVQSIIQDLLRRDAVGQAKYGTTMDRTDLTLKDWLQHNYEELVDATQYNRAAMHRLEAEEKAFTQMMSTLERISIDIACGNIRHLSIAGLRLEEALFRHKLDTTHFTNKA